jgi:plastocyanin
MAGRVVVHCLVAAACVLGLARCGGGGMAGPSGSEVTITITPTGVTPTEVHVPVGGHVTFLNSDVRLHAMSSDPIQTHTDCPPINDVGTLNPGQARSTGALTVARVCGFHDHTNELDPTWKGRIIVE